MPELHITSTLIAAEARATPATPGAPAAPAAGADEAGGFAAVLAGQLDPAPAVAAAADEKGERRQEPLEDQQAQQADATAQLLAALGMPQEVAKDPARATQAAIGGKVGETIAPLDAKPARGRGDALQARAAPEAALAAVDRTGVQGADQSAEALRHMQPLEASAAAGEFQQPGLQLEATPVAAPEAQPAQAARHAPALPGPVGTPHWREALGSSVTLLATQRVQSAELRVQPPELGPLQVSIRIEANEASVLFAAPHPETRQAIEDALPKLREMLEAGGLAVGNTSVGDPGAFERDTEQHAQSHASDSGQPAAGATAPMRLPARADQLIDVFA